MRKFVLIAAALTALGVTSVAVATLRSVDVTAASATLTATTPANVGTRTFTCDGQTFEITTGRWSGTATSTTADLNGAAVLHLKSVYNATKKLGWIDGRLSIAASDGRTHAHVSGVNTDGKLDAWLRGHAGRQDGALFGSLSGSFSKTGGPHRRRDRQRHGRECRPDREWLPLQAGADAASERALLVRGQIDALSATSISVKPKDGSASQVCAVSDDDDVDRVKVGDQVEMGCSQISGAWVLTKVRKK